MPNDMQPHSKTHTWILVLLFWVLAVTLFVAGYLLYGKNEKEMSAEELASACTAAVNSQIEESMDAAKPETCPETKSASYDATAKLPGFTYPLGWHLWLQRDLAGYDRLLSNDGPVEIIKDSDGAYWLFSIIGGPKSSLPMNEFPTATESSGNTTVQTRSNGTLTVVKSVMNDFTGATEEVIFFVGQNNAVKITLPDRTLSPHRNELDLFVDSLDFSKIE